MAFRKNISRFKSVHIIEKGRKSAKDFSTHFASINAISSSYTVHRSQRWSQLPAYLQTTHPAGFMTFLAACGAANLEAMQHERGTLQCLAGFHTPVGQSDLSSSYNLTSRLLSTWPFTILSPTPPNGLKIKHSTLFILLNPQMLCSSLLWLECALFPETLHAYNRIDLQQTFYLFSPSSRDLTFYRVCTDDWKSLNWSISSVMFSKRWSMLDFSTVCGLKNTW